VCGGNLRALRLWTRISNPRRNSSWRGGGGPRFCTLMTANLNLLHPKITYIYIYIIERNSNLLHSNFAFESVSIAISAAAAQASAAALAAIWNSRSRRNAVRKRLWFPVRKRLWFPERKLLWLQTRAWQRLKLLRRLGRCGCFARRRDATQHACCVCVCARVPRRAPSPRYTTHTQLT
jgi:hypothetical protein